jgi:flagellar hook-basal body complex protein FliE
MVKDAMTQVNQAARASDAQSHSMAAGKANVVDVVTAVAESEVAVGALVAVRDRVIAAYEEIMRMPI